MNNKRRIIYEIYTPAFCADFKDLTDKLNYIEELEVKCTEEYNIIKAKAYNVRIEDNYAIQLRDEFNKNAGKHEIVAQIKRKILDLLEKGAEE